MTSSTSTSILGKPDKLSPLEGENTLERAKKIDPRRLKGFQDFHPNIMTKRFEMMDIVRRVGRLSGFQPVGTGALEYADVLLGQGGETDKQVYQFEDNGGRQVGLRFDLTVPFARYVAEHQGTMIFPFKRLQIGDVWRAEKPQKGRYREFCQCDLDIIGVDSLAADVEILSCFQRIIGELDVGNFTQSVGNRQVLSALIHSFYSGISSDEEARVLGALDKLDKIGAEKASALLLKIMPASDVGKELIELLNLASTDAGLELVRVRLQDTPNALVELDRLVQTVDLVRNLDETSFGERQKKISGQNRGKICVDLRIARGLGYYTGIVFETTLDSLPHFGSISSGGRYNNLAERFCKRELAGVGGSLGLDRLVAAMEELKLVDSALSAKYLRHPGVFIAIASDQAVSYAFEVAVRLREVGISVDVSLKAGKIGSQFKLATRSGHHLILTVGELESKKRTYSIKNLRSNSEQRDLPIDGIIKKIQPYIEGDKACQKES